MNKIYFKEEQRFNHSWIWAILILTALSSTVPFLIGIYSQEVLHKPWGNHPTQTWVLVAFFVFGIFVMGGLILLITKMRLIVEIRSDGIWFQYPPFYKNWKCIKKEEIKSFEVGNYKPVLEYGGWGIKGGKRKKAYNVSGNIGLKILLKNGNKVLFGTQKKQSVLYAMEKLMIGEI